MIEWHAADTLFYLGLAAGGVLAGVGFIEILRFYLWLRRLRKVRQDFATNQGTRF